MFMPLVALLALAADPVPAAPDTNSATAAAAPTETEKAAKPKLICRRGQPTNSLVPTRKVCLSQEEWARRDGAVNGHRHN